jgi:putative GTP pyrophosphokinase
LLYYLNFVKSFDDKYGERLPKFLSDFTKGQLEKLEDNFFVKLNNKIETAEKAMSYYRCALMEIKTKLKVLNAEFSFLHERNPIDNIKTRIKDFESIRKKICQKKIVFTPDSIERNIHDIAGIRVICPFIDDIYMVSDCLLQQDDIKLLEVEDYIAQPKKNGYRSLHLIIEIPIFLHDEKRQMKVEVQLRTLAMEFWANLEHRLRYKKDTEEGTARRLSAELTGCAEKIAALDLEMMNIRDSIENTYENERGNL